MADRKTRQVAQAASLDRSDVDAAVRVEQVCLLYRQRTVVPVNLVIAGLTSVAVWRFYPIWMVMLWMGLFCALILARVHLRIRHQREERSAEQARRWGRVYTWGTFATGCLWGLIGSIVLVTSDPTYYVFVVFVLGGMMAAAIVGNAAYLPAMLGFMLPSILPMIALLVIRHSQLQIEMAAMLAAFATVLTIVGSNINRSIIENIRLRIEQNALSTKLKASEAAMAEAQSIANVGSWEVDPGSDNTVWSAETYRIHGLDPATVVPSFETVKARVHPDDRAAFARIYADLSPALTSQAIDYRVVMDDGSIKSVHGNARAVFDGDGRPVRIFGTVQDITRRKMVEEKLQFANILLKTEMDASLDGILVVAADRKILSFNPRFADMWGISQLKLEQGDDDAVLAQVTASIKEPEQFLKRVQYLYDHPDEASQDEVETTDGRFIDRHTVTLHTPAGEYLGRVWFFRDITKRKQSDARILRMARYDALTGLANRAVFVETLQHAIAQAGRGEKGFAVIYLDLDHFKDVNDTLGHPVGDELLKAVAERLRANTRAVDTVARFGGDEFAVVASEIAEPADAAILADKLIKSMAAPFPIQGNEIHSGASIGIDLYGPDASDAETLLSHADVALYRTKAEGRGSYRFFTDAMDAEVRTRVTLGAELREAVDSGQLFLMYQPQVAIDSGRINGLEALVRWRHPQRGVIGPDVFIPLAEKIGIIAKLGHWVLWTACRQAKMWFDAGAAPVRIGVNLSALHFKTPLTLEKDIVTALAETGLPPHLLELELTESVLMDTSHEHSDILLRLRQMGITVAIDDFGTGYSSLDYLRRFPVDRIKIAQNFVGHMETTPGDVAIVKATIGLARELGIAVIAEGVETPAQVRLLQGWGCGEAQGYYFAKPLPAEEIAPLLRIGAISRGVTPAPRTEKRRQLALV